MIKKDIIENIAKDTYLNHKAKFETLKERWLTLVDRYENKLREGSISANTESKITLGGAYALVENAIPRLLARQPKYRYMARARDDSESADMYDEFSEYQWNEAECQSKIKKVAKWGLVCGLSGWKMGWKEERKVYKKRTKEILGMEVKNKLLEPFAKTVLKDQEDILSNYTFEPLKPHDLIWSVEAEEVNDCRVIGYKSRATIKELKKDGYDVRDVVFNIRTSDLWKERLEQNDGISDYRANKMIEDVEVEVAELYVRVLNDQGYYEYWVVTLACYGEDNPETIRCEQNTLDRNFAPVGIFRPIDRLGKFYGFGLVEPVQGVLDAEEDTLNMAIEALWTDVSRPMEYVPANLLAPDAIQYKPRTLVPVKILGQSVAVMQTPTPNMNGVQYVNDFLNKAKQNTSGITDYQTGSDQLKGNKTLGEIQIKTQESNARITMIMDNFEKQVLEPMGKYALWMNQQFLADNKKIIYRVLGKKGNVMEKNIKFKDIEAVKDVVVVSGSTMLASQQAELQKWSLLLNQVYMEEKSLNPTPINKEAIWERIFENGVQIKDVENFLPNAKEREEGDVQGQMAQLQDAKEESANPQTARVLPTDNHEVHLEIHKAALNAGGIDHPYAPEEQAMLQQHINDHVRVMGGAVPPYQQGMEQAVNNQVMQPNEAANNEAGGGAV
jgi:hypothetical protein